MARWHFGTQTYPVTAETRWRHRFSILAVCVAVLLISWGGLVTSIDAGLAVPDWPASFGSYDPFKTGFEDPSDPNARWWHRLPILAEHGHRLIGALMGILTIILALWTWRADPRRWMRTLGVVAVGLVIVQGVLGGLRVIWVSLDLAVVHACFAQIFFALLVAMTLFTSRGWLRATSVPARGPATRRLTGLGLATIGMLYVQIILGALLRHPGAGVHPLFVAVHITGAFVVLGLVATVFGTVRRHFAEQRLLRRGATFMMSLVLVQIVLGFSAYVVLLYETSMALRSTLQVVLNSTHLVVGALLMAATVSTVLLSLRRPSETAPSADTADTTRPSVAATA
jgi:cytochrome c oxidase assembly protein subunit 15